MVLLQNACFCFRLKTAALVIGIVGMIFSIMSLVPTTLKLIHNRHCDLHRNYTSCQHSIFSSNYWYLHDPELHLNHDFSFILWLSIYMFCCILLIYGTLKGSRFLLIPWLAMEGGSLASQIVATSVSISRTGRHLEEMLLISFRMFVIGIFINFWFIILSFYQVLHEEYLESSRNSSKTSSKNSPPPSYSQVVDMTEPPPYSSLVLDVHTVDQKE